MSSSTILPCSPYPPPPAPPRPPEVGSSPSGFNIKPVRGRIQKAPENLGRNDRRTPSKKPDSQPQFQPQKPRQNSHNSAPTPPSDQDPSDALQDPAIPSQKRPAHTRLLQ